MTIHSIKVLDVVWVLDTPSWYGLVLFFFFCCVLGETTALEEIVEEVVGVCALVHDGQDPDNAALDSAIQRVR